MSRSETANSPNARPNSAGWRWMYIAGGVAALLAVIFFRRNTGTELLAFRGFGVFDVPEVVPSTASGWFALLQDSPLLGAVLFDVIDLVNYALVGLILLALYGALRRTHRGVMLVATVCGLAGAAVYLVSNQAIAMLSLSAKYASATSDTQRALFLADGEALLTVHNPGVIFQGTGYFLSLFLVLVAGLVISVVMLRSTVFWRATSYVGMLANGLALCFFVALAFALTPALLAIPMVLSAPFRMAWYILIALGLFRLGSGEIVEKPVSDDFGAT